MVIFRENTEDIYAGIEWANGTEQVKKVIKFLQEEMGVKKIRFPNSSGIGIKPISVEGTERLVRAAIKYAIDNKRKSVTIVHKGNIMKFHGRQLPRHGYALAKREFGGVEIDGGPWPKLPERHRDQGLIADAFLQQIPAAPGRVRRDRHHQPQRRLHLRCAGGAGRRHRHRAGGQHLRPVRLLRGHHGTAPKYAGKTR